jgi:hypothetical protein
MSGPDLASPLSFPSPSFPSSNLASAMMLDCHASGVDAFYSRLNSLRIYFVFSLYFCSTYVRYGQTEKTARSKQEVFFLPYTSHTLRTLRWLLATLTRDSLFASFSSASRPIRLFTFSLLDNRGLELRAS